MNKLLVLLILFGIFGVASADGDAFEEGKGLVDSNISCDQLTEHQLEEIGEYIMEQMHSGTSHEAMHEMMGFKEGDPEEEKFHVNLAKTMYCWDNKSGGMMGSGMMSRGMKSNMMQNMTGIGSAGTPYGMMGYYNTANIFGWDVFHILLLVLLIGLIILVYLNILTKLKEGKKR